MKRVLKSAARGPRASSAGVVSPARAEERVFAQVWIESIAEDPEAISALGVARRTLAMGGALKSLRRVRLIELEGALPEAAALAARLHDSTWFYNPYKERCRVRLFREDAPPLEPAERAALVFDREGERRPASERWWKRVTGDAIRVREGTAWIAAGPTAAESDALLNELLPGEGPRRGLLCNPHAQEFRRAEAVVPLPWFAARATTPRRKS